MFGTRLGLPLRCPGADDARDWGQHGDRHHLHHVSRGGNRGCGYGQDLQGGVTYTQSPGQVGKLQGPPGRRQEAREPGAAILGRSCGGAGGTACAVAIRAVAWGLRPWCAGEELPSRGSTGEYGVKGAGRTAQQEDGRPEHGAGGLEGEVLGGGGIPTAT